MNSVVVCALYQFAALPNYRQLRQPLLDVCVEHGIKGTLLLADEGINGTVAGSRNGIDQLLSYLRRDERFQPLQRKPWQYKESYCQAMPFYRIKVKLKAEIVTMGVDGINPSRLVGTYVKPGDWNQLISDPEVTVIDTRNYYEVAIGTFQGAKNPNTHNFREFPTYVKSHLDPEVHKKVAMFCTGGIRCEKSTAYLKTQGFEQVYHLEGGILKYLEQVPATDSLWRGECFVFDNRVSVDHALARGSYDQCHGCRHPITADDKLSEKYLPGVSCPRCYDRQTPDQRRRFQERQRQVALARVRGHVHIGAPPSSRRS